MIDAMGMGRCAWRTVLGLGGLALRTGRRSRHSGAPPSLTQSDVRPKRRNDGALL